MPRSIWNGTITFGLIAVPIKVHSATEDKSVHFHLVHEKDGARVNLKRFCSKEGKEVPYKQVAKGYETRAGEYVMLSQEEINAAAGERSRLIELEEFVCQEHIDPVFYDRSYYLGAGEDGQDAYRLLHDALARCARAGIGRWVFHNREYLVVVRPMRDDPGGARKGEAGRRANGRSAGILGLHTMRFADELVDAADLEVPEPSRAPSKREIEMAGELVDSLHHKFKPGAFKDTYRERLLDMLTRKAKGEEIEIEQPREHEPSDDLMAALEASLASGGKGSRKRKKSTARS